MNVKLYLSSDIWIEVRGLKNHSGNAFVNDATVTAKLIDSADATVAGSTVTLDYVTSSNGDYEKNIPNTITLTENGTYTCEIIATASGIKQTWRVPCTAVYKTLTN